MTVDQEQRRQRLSEIQHEWKERVQEALGGNPSDGVRWTEVTGIVRVLNSLGTRENVSTLFLPDGDWGFFTGASGAPNGDGIECFAQGSHKASPRALTFNCVDAEMAWSYFWLDAAEGPFAVFSTASPYSRHWAKKEIARLATLERGQRDHFGQVPVVSRHAKMDAGAFRAHIDESYASSLTNKRR